MIISKDAITLLLASFLIITPLVSQESQDSTNVDYSYKFFDYRGTNIVEAGLGGATLFGDFESTKTGFYYRVGYKRFLTPHLFLGLSANGYNVTAEEIDYNLMSFDFNLEILMLPYDKFSPYAYGGFGINTSGDVDANAVKTQIGIGIEYMVMDKLGLRMFYEYNYSFEDEMEFLIADERNDKFLRFGLGLNFYFGGEKERQKRTEDMETIINSNLLDSNN